MKRSMLLSAVLVCGACITTPAYDGYIVSCDNVGDICVDAVHLETYDWLADAACELRCVEIGCHDPTEGSWSAPPACFADFAWLDAVLDEGIGEAQGRWQCPSRVEVAPGAEPPNDASGEWHPMPPVEPRPGWFDVCAEGRTMAEEVCQNACDQEVYTWLDVFGEGGVHFRVQNSPVTIHHSHACDFLGAPKLVDTCTPFVPGVTTGMMHSSGGEAPINGTGDFVVSGSLVRLDHLQLKAPSLTLPTQQGPVEIRDLVLELKTPTMASLEGTEVVFPADSIHVAIRGMMSSSRTPMYAEGRLSTAVHGQLLRDHRLQLDMPEVPWLEEASLQIVVEGARNAERER
ncbi:MAG: hypothetical protein AAGA48_33190 [Myxococcota bacterium]